MKHLQPDGWPQPRGYSNGVMADGRQIFVAGMIGWDHEGRFADGFSAQLKRALENTVAVLAEAGAGPEHVVRMTWYVTDLDAYRTSLGEIGGVYRDVMGRHFPPMAVVGVTGLVEKAALVEIESTAIIERGRSSAP